MYHFIHAGGQVPAELKEGCLGAALAIWTTTPWTMPANAAVAVNEKLQYTLVEAKVSCLIAYSIFCLLSNHWSCTNMVQVVDLVWICSLCPDCSKTAQVSSISAQSNFRLDQISDLIRLLCSNLLQ